MRPPHFTAGIRTTWRSLAIYAAIMLGYALLMTWYYPTIVESINDPMAEGDGIQLTELGRDRYNLTWDIRIGAGYHLAVGGEDLKTYTAIAMYIQDPDMGHSGPGLNTTFIEAMLRGGMSNGSVIADAGIELYYSGQGDHVEFDRGVNITYFWVIFMASETNMTPVNISAPVSTSDLIVTSQFDDYLKDNTMVKGMFGSSELDFTTFKGYISMEFFSMWPLLFVIFLVIKASGTISKHVEDKSMDILLATGYSRERFLAEGVMLHGVNMVVVAAAAFGGLVSGCVLIGEPVPWSSLLIAFAGSLPMAFAFIGVAVLISVLVDEVMKCIGAVMGVVVGSYIIQVISNLAPDTVGDVLGYVCLFKYYDAYSLMMDLNMPWENLMVPTVVGVAAFVTAFVLFHRKEIHA